MYLNSPTNTVTIKESGYVNYASASNGAVIYTGTAATSVTLTISSSTFSILSASSRGSFAYIEGDSTPITTITLTSSGWYCQTYELWYGS